MAYVAINILTVPGGRGEVLEQRFANRAGMVEQSPGFEHFELLRPVDGTDQYLVYTRWKSREDFEAWTKSQAFTAGHARASADAAAAAGHGHGHDDGHGHGHGHGDEAAHAAPHAPAHKSAEPAEPVDEHAGHDHAGHGAHAAGAPAAGPASTGSSIWGFEVVTEA